VDDLLATAIAAAPRRYRMPALPRDAAQARGAPVDVALAFAMEHARTAPSAELRELFLGALAALVEQALDAATGDPAFRAAVVREGDADVREFVALQSTAVTDERAVRRAVDAVAHPARLSRLPDGEAAALEGLHGLSRQADWIALRGRAAGVLDAAVTDGPLLRLARAQQLCAHPGVARYLELLRGQGPLRGSDEAGRQGRDAARSGDAAEAAAVAALRSIAGLLPAPNGTPWSVGRGLRTPRGFPGENAKAKDEWDVALLGGAADAAAVVLLGEVKASPAAAVADYHRLVRGLQRLAQAQAGVAYEFASADGPVVLAGESLRALEPQGGELPAHVLYFSTAASAELPVLSAPARAVLLAEPACIAWAREQDPAVLAPAWDALLSQPRVRAALHQYDTGRRACERMLHPDDLLEAVRRALPRS
jgi:hypothetical protein